MKRDEVERLVVYADGGCKGNGTKDAKVYGSFAVFAVLKLGGQPIKVQEKMLDFPEHSTNNQGEYQTLIEALDYLYDLRIKGFNYPITIYMDSALVVNQVTGVWKTKDADLKGLCGVARGLLHSSIRLNQVPREEIVKVLGH